MHNRRKTLALAAPLAVLALFAGAAPAGATCALGNGIQRVIHITFDNVHLRRDNPNVPSDLEQMPNLLNFLQSNGVVSGNHHTPIISHTAGDILSELTAESGRRMLIETVEELAEDETRR